ncbi:Ureide permease 4, partial [Frankliniella fusca]
EHDKQSTHSPAFSLARGQQWNEVPRQDGPVLLQTHFLH